MSYHLRQRGREHIILERRQVAERWRTECIEEAKQDWKTGRFKPVPGEDEFIPLPNS